MTNQHNSAHLPPTFVSLGVPDPLVKVLASEGKTTAFPIQQATLADTFKGRDVLGRGRTGSGKTLAFSLPMVARLAAESPHRVNEPHRPRALVLAPTRELASQIAGVIDPLADIYNQRVTTVYGGVKQTRQERELSRGAAIVVACPGRLEDLMGQKIISLNDIAITVIDEADLMADMGFLPAVTRILKATPPHGQRMLFSATLDNGVDRLVNKFLHNPVLHSVDPAESPVERMTHYVFAVDDKDKRKEMVFALASGVGKRIFFFRTKHQAKRFARQLTAAGIPAVDLQGNLSQNARDRNLAAFESGKVKVLTATDVAARGVDVANVELVVHADPPREYKEYLHRSGRTARAGASGSVVTLCMPADQRDLMMTLRKAKISAKAHRVSPDSPEVEALIGEHAALVTPQPSSSTSPNRKPKKTRQIPPRKKLHNSRIEQYVETMPAPTTEESWRPSRKGGESPRSSKRTSSSRRRSRDHADTTPERTRSSVSTKSSRYNGEGIQETVSSSRTPRKKNRRQTSQH